MRVGLVGTLIELVGWLVHYWRLIGWLAQHWRLIGWMVHHWRLIGWLVHHLRLIGWMVHHRCLIGWMVELQEFLLKSIRYKHAIYFYSSAHEQSNCFMIFFLYHALK